VATHYGDTLSGKVVVEISNPVNMETFDALVVDAGSSAAEEVAKSLVNSPVNLTARVGADDRLFGSITTADIAEAISVQKGVTIDRKQIVLADPIKTIGTHLVPVKLHANVEFPVTVEVASDAVG